MNSSSLSPLKNAFLIGFAGLTAYIILRAQIGLPFQQVTGFLHPLLALGFVLLHAREREGPAPAALLVVLVVAVTLLSEAVGVATGWVFGAYHYTDRLGPLFLNLVPYVIPLIWLYMLYPAYVMASHLIPAAWQGRARHLGTAALGGLIITSWDLIVDPLMVQRGHWVWESPGAYFGIPVHNFIGWWLTSFVTLSIYLWLRGKTLPPKRLPPLADRQAILLYAITGMSTVIGGWQAGLDAPAWIGLLAMGVWVTLSWRCTARHEGREST